MTDDQSRPGYLRRSVASVATILVEVPTREAVTDAFDGAGLDYRIEDDLVRTSVRRAIDDAAPVELLVDVDAGDGVVHVHTEEYPDAYGLAPVASAFLAALDADESQSLFTYSVSFEHPLVGFETLVDRLDGDGVTYHPPAEESGETTEPADAEDGTSQEPPRPGDRDGRGRAHLVVDVDGDRFELYEDGYLLPVDDASGEAVDRFLAAVDRRLASSFPDPPAALSAAELPDGWAGPLVARHPDVGAVADAWGEVADGIAPGGEAPAGFDGDATDLATAVLDTAASLLYALDGCSPETRGLYYDRYADDERSPHRLAIALDDGLEDRDRFLERSFWTPELRRAVDATRSEIRELGPVVDSYEGLDLRPGQVWRREDADTGRIDVVELTGRESAGDRFVSLPVWVGEVRTVEHRPGDAPGSPPAGSTGDAEGSTDDAEGSPGGETVIVDGGDLVELVEPAG